MYPPDNKTPLDGLVVADFTRILAGPLATMILGDLGATVIKIERPGVGDDSRDWGPPFVDGMSTYFTAVNRNKFSIALDLRRRDDLATARRIVRRSDILIQNFRPGTVNKYGLDAETLMLEQPGLVYCSITGFGASSDLPAYDFIVQAMGGLMSVTGSEESGPMKVGVALVDVLTALYATLGILGALRVRDQTSRGQHVEVSLFSTLLSSMVNQLSGYLNGGPVPGLLGNRHPSIAPYEAIRAADGDIALAVGNDQQFGALCAVVGRADLATDHRFVTNAHRVANRDALVRELENACRRIRVADLQAQLESAAVPCGPVNDMAGALRYAAEVGLDPVVWHSMASTGIATVASPLKLSRTPVQYHRAPPVLGADGDLVRAWLDGTRGRLVDGQHQRVPMDQSRRR